MRRSKAEAAQTRGRIVAEASTAFRRDGVRATGLADLMAAAGLTHGGFYKHFPSKDAVVAEAAAAAVNALADELAAGLTGGAGGAGNGGRGRPLPLGRAPRRPGRRVPRGRHG